MVKVRQQSLCSPCPQCNNQEPISIRTLSRTKHFCSFPWEKQLPQDPQPPLSHPQPCSHPAGTGSTCRARSSGVSSWGRSRCYEGGTSCIPPPAWPGAACWTASPPSWIWHLWAWPCRQISGHSAGPCEGHSWKRWTSPREQPAHTDRWTFLQKETGQPHLLRWLSRTSYPRIKANKGMHPTPITHLTSHKWCQIKFSLRKISLIL